MESTQKAGSAVKEIDLVYIYGDGYSKWRGQELMYSLRSVEKYVHNFRSVFIVGDFPCYLNQKAIHVLSPEDPRHCKERRIMNKLLKACDTEEISNPFLLYNDDYFHVSPFNALCVPGLLSVYAAAEN